jgi:ATP-binding cassette subfamily B protein
MVPQTAQLVSGTVRSNLCWRDANASDQELWRALEIAQAADFVRSLEAGLDAPVEAGGKNFSGGQRQRLTIARALVGDPKILVLDDSSSALDLQTDARLRRSLRQLAFASAEASGPGAPVPLTTVIVSQRVSSVRDADLICVMRRGRAVGLGTHAQLLSTCDVYREICESQLEREEVA